MAGTNKRNLEKGTEIDHGKMLHTSLLSYTTQAQLLLAPPTVGWMGLLHQPLIKKSFTLAYKSIL